MVDITTPRFTQILVSSQPYVNLPAGCGYSIDSKPFMTAGGHLQLKTVDFSNVFPTDRVAGRLVAFFNNGGNGYQLNLDDGTRIFPVQSLPATVSNRGNNGGAISWNGQRQQFWDSPLTANQSVAVTTTNMADGDEYRLTRTLAATGAFALTISYGLNGTLTKNLSVPGAWALFRYDSAAGFLRLAESGTLTTTHAIAFAVSGIPSAGQVLANFFLPYPITVDATMCGGVSKAAATASYVMTLKRAGTAVATWTWAAGATVPTVSVITASLAAGNFTLEGAATADATLDSPSPTLGYAR